MLGALNGAAAAAGVTDGGMAPAKLTAVKLCDKLGSRARLDGAKLERGALEHATMSHARRLSLSLSLSRSPSLSLSLKLRHSLGQHAGSPAGQDPFSVR